MDQLVQQSFSLGFLLPFITAALLLVLGKTKTPEVALRSSLALLSGFFLVGVLQHLLWMSFRYLPPLLLLLALATSKNVSFFRALGVVALGFGSSFLVSFMLFALIVGSG